MARSRYELATGNAGKLEARSELKTTLESASVDFGGWARKRQPIRITAGEHTKTDLHI